MLRRRLVLLVVICLVISVVGVYAGRKTASSAMTDPALHIDIPVKLEKANVVLNIDHMAFKGDASIAIGHLFLLANDYRTSNTKGEIVGLFHTDAGYATLDDASYNAERSVTTGNPFKAQLIALMNQGVHIELCGATARAFHWGNADLIPGIKVNTDAMVRLTQLHEEGYAEIAE